MNVLFVTLPERGHLHPMLGPAAEIARRGHRVAFHAARDISRALAAIGFEQLRAQEVPPPAESNRGAALAALVRDPPRLRAWIKALLLDGVPAAIDRLARVVDEFQPRVIVADPMAYEAPIVAARAGIRGSVPVAMTPAGGPSTASAMSRAISVTITPSTSWLNT